MNLSATIRSLLLIGHSSLSTEIDQDKDIPIIEGKSMHQALLKSSIMRAQVTVCMMKMRLSL